VFQRDILQELPPIELLGVESFEAHRNQKFVKGDLGPGLLFTMRTPNILAADAFPPEGRISMEIATDSHRLVYVYPVVRANS
jgi:hypothetical protein